MKRLIRAILKVIFLVIVLITMNFVLDLIIDFFPCMKIILLIVAIIGLVTIYYLKNEED